MPGEFEAITGQHAACAEYRTSGVFSSQRDGTTSTSRSSNMLEILELWNIPQNLIQSMIYLG